MLSEVLHLYKKASSAKVNLYAFWAGQDTMLSTITAKKAYLGKRLYWEILVQMTLLS